MRLRGSTLGLRARATLAFGLVGLFTAVVLAAATYFTARSYLLDQREQSAERQTFANARLTRSALRSTGTDVAALLTTIQGEAGSDVVVRYDGGWYASSVGIGQDDVPVDLRKLVRDGHAGHQLERADGGELRLTVGTPLPAVDGAYFEVFQLRQLDETLETLRNILVVTALLTSIVAASLGRFAAGRIVGPLAPIAAAAGRISEGDLETRLSAPGDADLSALIESFNSMAESLQARIEREARFASDVSHELRSPLAAMRAAIEVIARRHEELPESVEATFEVLAARIRSFETLVLELLEIARFDAHAIALEPEDLDVEVFVQNVLRTNDCRAEIHIRPDAPPHIRADRRRLAQAMGTIIDNAALYADGLTDVVVEGAGDSVRLCLDDAGPGVGPADREVVLQRFARGDAGRQAGSGSGTGLGLALAVAQVELHGGRILVEDAPRGGARFVIELPAREEPT